MKNSAIASPRRKPGARANARRLFWIPAFAGMTMALLPMVGAQAGDESGTIQSGGYERSYIAYVPDKLRPGAPLLLALHGTGGTGERLRAFTGGEFDKLADAHGFAVIYPTGYKNTWDDCRKTDTTASKQLHIDDIGFFRALVARFHDTHGIDPRRVIVMGYSNGAQMAMRVALEAPDTVAAIAAVSANLPVPDNFICHPSAKPTAVLMMDGTADPVNPFRGGEVILSHGQSRGVVMSTDATARYWAKLDGYTGDPETDTLPHREAADPTSVTVWDWHEAGKKPVIAFIVNGGGHVVPNPHFPPLPMLGKVTRDIDAPQAIWGFFASVMK
jgi:polyhydroxybutyrate depolymerase